MTRSKVVFEDGAYVVCLTRAGLSVQNKNKGDGKLLATGTKAFREWLEAFTSAIDRQESNALARAIYQADVRP